MYWNKEKHKKEFKAQGLTLTWDVLKYNWISIDCGSIMININMRCIEIKFTS